MDLAELLMVDHSSIRIIADNNLLQNSRIYQGMPQLHQRIWTRIFYQDSLLLLFFLNIHVNIEESIVFPLLKVTINNLETGNFGWSQTLHNFGLLSEEFSDELKSHWKRQ